VIEVLDQPQQWLAGALDSDAAGIIVLSVGGTIAASNAQALQLFACANGEELRASCQPILKRLTSGLPRTDSPPAQQFELQIGAGRPPAGKIVVSAHPLGATHWLLLTRSDATARQFDGVLEHAARNQLLHRLYGTMRHDLHSPIQAVMWTFDLLQRAAQQAQVAPEQRTQLEESASLGRKELDRLKGSVRRFLSYATPVGAERERIDVGELAESVQQVISAEASLFEVKMTTQPSAQPLFVDGVRGQLEQAVATLMLNAVDAAPAGGTVSTTVREHEGRAEIIVSSSRAAEGAAVPRHNHDHAVDASPRSAVGLHAARAVAASLGGDISEPAGNGARTFRMRLPLARARTAVV
jgi:signal transduction histidine kinase